MNSMVLRLNELSPARITAGSTTIALHLIAFALMLMPPRLLSELPRPAPEVPMTAEILARVTPKPLPVPPVPTPPTRPTPRTTPTPERVTVTVTETSMPLPISTPLEPVSSEPTGDPAPFVADQSAQLAYDTATPPPYPSMALRRGWEGTVMLRVRVDETGRPREVVVERSSGRTLLDRAASEHVLARWRFQAAIVGGRAVSAWAMVPVRFQIAKS